MAALKAIVGTRPLPTLLPSMADSVEGRRLLCRGTVKSNALPVGHGVLVELPLALAKRRGRAPLTDVDLRADLGQQRGDLPVRSRLYGP